MHDTQLSAVIYTGKYGRDPLDPRVWSSSSQFFFTALREQGMLHRAIGIDLPAWKRTIYLARNCHFGRKRWRLAFLSDPRYRKALTGEVARQLSEADRKHPILQIGAMYNVRAVVGKDTPCYSYHDGNLAELLRSPDAPKGLGAKTVERGLAYEARVYQDMDKIFTMSEYLRQSFIRDFGVAADKLVNIGAGINLARIPEDGPDKHYDSLQILFIGIDFARKGGWQLLEAFRRVRQKMPQAALHLVGPRALSIPPHFQEGVVLHGFLNKRIPHQAAALERLFDQCCLFVMPSLYEPFGIAPLEAMAHRIPCVVTDGWALRETVTHGVTGALVRSPDVDALESQLLAMLSDSKALCTMGEAAYKFVSERYTWEHVVNRLRAALSDDGKVASASAFSTNPSLIGHCRPSLKASGTETI